MNKYYRLLRLGKKLYLQGQNVQQAEIKIVELRESGNSFSSAQILKAYRVHYTS